MIYLKLFLVFLKIGAVSFGGGYGMFSLIREEALANSWLTEDELLNFVAVSESTPGPIAVNIATFVGSSQGGILGAFLATLGVVLPAFLIILLIASVIRGFINYGGVKAALSGIRPAVVGLILATAVTMLWGLILNVTTVGGGINFDWKSLVIFVLLGGLTFTLYKWKKISLSPILLILISAALGIVLYAFIP